VDSAISGDSADLSSFTAPFLRRLLLEKADFKADQDLGYAIIVLYSETFFTSGSQLRLPFEVESDGFSEFLRLQSVRRSIIEGLLLANVQMQPDGGYLIIWPDEPKKFRKQRCVIDVSFVRQVDFDRESPDAPRVWDSLQQMALSQQGLKPENELLPPIARPRSGGIHR